MLYQQYHLVLPFIALLCLVSDSIAAPVPIGPTGNHKRLLSRSSGLFVHIGENGTLDGGGSSISAAVFTVTFRDTFYAFESGTNTNMYLMMQATNVAMETDENFNTTGNVSKRFEEMTVFVGRVAAESNDWKWNIRTFDDDASIQVIHTQRADCYLAFNEDSSIAGPCNMSNDDPRTYFDLMYKRTFAY